jgi:hypothetical protein
MKIKTSASISNIKDMVALKIENNALKAENTKLAQDLETAEGVSMYLRAELEAALVQPGDEDMTVEEYTELEAEWEAAGGDSTLADLEKEVSKVTNFEAERDAYICGITKNNGYWMVRGSSDAGRYYIGSAKTFNEAVFLKVDDDMENDIDLQESDAHHYIVSKDLMFECAEFMHM